MNLHSPLRFEEKSFTETILGEPPSAEIGAAFLKLEDGRAFFVTGAGSSAGNPTALPTGPKLAEILEEWARPVGFAQEIDDLADRTDLGQICELLSGGIGRADVIREIQQQIKWRDSEFNLCHLAIALFFGEGMLSVSFTANWDPKIGDAFQVVGAVKEPAVVWDKGMMSVVGGDAHFVHLHGYWDDPASLVMTTAELARPDALKWTEPSLKSALSNRDPIFVGFSAEPEYVVRSLAEMRAVMEQAPSSVIGLEDVAAYREKSPILSKALGLDDDQSRYIQGDACEVMGELLRCAYRKRIEELTEDAVARIGATENLSRFFSPGAAAKVRAILEDMTLEEFLALLWGTTARTAELGSCPQRTIASCADDFAETLGVLISLYSCPDAEDLQKLHSGFRIVGPGGSAVELSPALPEELISAFTAQVRAGKFNDRLSGPGSADDPMVLICAGTVGALPPKDAKVSLVGARPSTSVSASNRTPADVISFDELDRRFGEIADEAPTLARVLRT